MEAQGSRDDRTFGACTVSIYRRSSRHRLCVGLQSVLMQPPNVSSQTIAMSLRSSSIERHQAGTMHSASRRSVYHPLPWACKASWARLSGQACVGAMWWEWNAI